MQIKIASAVGLSMALMGCLSDGTDTPGAGEEIAQSEHALINGLVLATQYSANDTDWGKSPDVYCPSGLKVLGGGGVMGAGPSNVLFRGNIPFSSLTGMQSAIQVDKAGNNLPWYMISVAICAVPPAGLEYVESISPYGSTSPRTWTASCPAGKKVLGAGGTITNAEGLVQINAIRPNASLDQVTVIAAEVPGGTSRNWYLHAYAVCAYPQPGQVRVAASVTVDDDGQGPNDRAAFSAVCPGEKRLVGGGGEINAPEHVRIDSMLPLEDLKSYFLRAEEQGNSTVPWTATSYAICVDG
jgi:hypothetical protein